LPPIAQLAPCEASKKELILENQAKVIAEMYQSKELLIPHNPSFAVTTAP